MCLCITIICPGNCGTHLFSNELIAACKFSTIYPPPANFHETHDVDHGVIALSPDQAQRRFPQGYACVQPGCSHHPGAVTTMDLTTLFRCPGCGFAHSWSGNSFVETWVAQNGVSLPFLHKSQWAGFACSQRRLCHFNPDYQRELSDEVRAIEVKIRNTFNDDFVPAWTEEDEETLRLMMEEDASTENDSLATLAQTEMLTSQEEAGQSTAEGTPEPRSALIWSDADIATLRKMKAEGAPTVNIALALGRKANGVSYKWSALLKADRRAQPRKYRLILPRP
ncbi:hypothetical protein VP1G_06744 [Cytospora mali]|uniref:Uncharacterized protein n=1 Tax=Cytospora mali TaxID=578113 RepID=A0A194V6I9_CYTMA|nr:hypothetical protein VP1G_06744 [Valsa mali var. pyri (nom. inval.)]